MVHMIYIRCLEGLKKEAKGKTKETGSSTINQMMHQQTEDTYNGQVPPYGEEDLVLPIAPPLRHVFWQKQDLP